MVFFESHDSQFGFKKGTGCSHAVYSVKAVVDFCTNQGTTVNLCALDLKKAFDKMNHFGLYIKLLGRMIPNCLLSLTEHCYLCAIWTGAAAKLALTVAKVSIGSVLVGI